MRTHRSRNRTGRVLLAAAVALALGAAPASAATPAIPDDSPIATGSSGPSTTVENPSITVTMPDGTPVGGRTVHRGDQLLVHGSGFDPEANKGGFPLPIPPGTPNGVYVLYSAFPDHWKPSEDAPSENRTHPHDRMAWVMPEGTLEKVPDKGLNMRRVLARVHQPMNADGTFHALITVDPPEQTPGDNWGVYVYAAAGSVNAAEELHVPIPYSPEPGPNTPPPSSPDLVFDVATLHKIAETAGGGVTPKKGAVPAGEGKVGYTLVSDGRDGSGAGIVKYRGLADIAAKFSIVDVVVKDPWIEVGPKGTVITAEVSKGYDVGPDEVERRVIAYVLKGGEGDPGTLVTTLGKVERVR